MQQIRQQEGMKAGAEKEHCVDGKSAVQIKAAAGSIASSQESCPRTHDKADEEARVYQDPKTASTEAPSTAAASQLSRQPARVPASDVRTDSRETQEVSQRSAPATVSVQVPASGQAEPDIKRRPSSPDSMDSMHILKPLTPAQSSEHSPGSSTADTRSRQPSLEADRGACAGVAARPAQDRAAAPLSCNVCNISTTSQELLQQHLQGRRHQKVLARHDSASEADTRYLALC